jgi:hypothetical protein
LVADIRDRKIKLPPLSAIDRFRGFESFRKEINTDQPVKAYFLVCRGKEGLHSNFLKYQKEILEILNGNSKKIEYAVLSYDRPSQEKINDFCLREGLTL